MFLEKVSVEGLKGAKKGRLLVAEVEAISNVGRNSCPDEPGAQTLP